MKRKKYTAQRWEQTAKYKEWGRRTEEERVRGGKLESERDSEWERHKHTREKESTLGRKSGGWRIEK